VKLQAIAPGMVATPLTDLGGPDGLSPKSRQYVGIVLGQVLKDALQLESLEPSPVTIPYAIEPTKWSPCRWLGHRAGPPTRVIPPTVG
jgi:hypothetical protein